MEHFKQLLTQYTGLTIIGSDYDKVSKFLDSRLAELRLDTLADYCACLTASNWTADQEWQLVVQALTVPESFFLRDKGQMEILRQYILPELIQHNYHRRQLKIWSAGCSTGEEPYSLAMLVQKVLPDINDWDVQIFGTDINDKVLAKAREGLYSRWSLRDVEPEILAYFQPAAQGLLELDASVREKVKFRRVNLLKTPFPDLEINALDLILCRNVFIYFEQSAIATVLDKFTQTLKPGGYLLTGHGELYQQTLNGLQTRLFLESVVYQRTENALANALSDIVFKPTVPAAPPPAVNLESCGDLCAPLENTGVANMGLAYQQGDYLGVLAIAQTVMSQQPDFDVDYWSAKAFASLGHYHTAETRLQSALALNPRSVQCHYLLAHIKEAQNDIEQAKSLLGKAIVLDEQFVPAYLDLAALCEQDEPLKYRQMREQALALLNKLPPEHYFEDFAAHACELIQQLH